MATATDIAERLRDARQLLDQAAALAEQLGIEIDFLEFKYVPGLGWLDADNKAVNFLTSSVAR